MNKKIFTLLASSLMLLFAAIGMNAQPNDLGGPVHSLPAGVGTGAYHLRVTHFGDDSPADGTGLIPQTDMVVALDSAGYLKLVDGTYFQTTVDKWYTRLRESLWCVEVKDREVLGRWPAYNFINKEYGTLLAVDSGRWAGNEYDVSAFTNPLYQTIWSQLTGYSSNPANYGLKNISAYLDGMFANWRFSETYSNTPLQPAQPLLIEIPGQPSYFLTFATRLNWPVGAAGPGIEDGIATIELVKVHQRDLDPGSDFYNNSLLRFELVNAAPRVLNAAAFNTRFGTQPLDPPGTTSTGLLRFNRDVSGAGVTNVLAQALRATDVYGNGMGQYMTLNTGGSSGNGRRYVHVADGDTLANYYSDRGIYYPIIKMTNYAGVNANGHFRMVYYPSEDSLVINVRAFDHINNGEHWDGEPSTAYPGIANGGAGLYDLDQPYGPVDNLNLFYNDEILTYLNVRMQDLVTAENKRVITVSDYPVNTHISFGIGGCTVSDSRTVVPRDLYVIKDSRGRYLTMPLELGDFTPQWLEPRNNEDPMKTPSYHWLVYPMNENAGYSTLRFINREFDWVIIDNVSIYATPTLFNGNINWLEWSGAYWNNDFENIFGTKGNALVYYSAAETSPATPKWNLEQGWNGSFLKVQDDKLSAAKKTARLSMTEEEIQKLYRTSSILGYKYIGRDTLSYHTYAFNYLHAYSKDFYLGPKPNQTRDTLLYAINGTNHFELILPDNQTGTNGTTEKYGIGWTFDLTTHPSTADIAPLERYYYHFKENDYWNFVWNNNFVVLGENARYGFTDERIANTRTIEKSAFYLRFTYQPEGMPEYYTLLERVKQSTALYMANYMNLHIAQTLKVYDNSHGGALNPAPGVAVDTVGIVVLGIDDNTLFARAQAKVTGNVVSTFAVSTETEPLYRRFNEGVYIPSGIDAGVDDGGIKANDDPRLVKIYRAYNAEKPAGTVPRGVDYLYEDANSVNAREQHKWDNESMGINFLSLENIYDHQNWLDQNVNHLDHGKYAFYLDTAYVNRGTGHIKPQYLIVVGPEDINANSCQLCDRPLDLKKGIYGRFLINATDSARGINRWSATNPTVRDNRYLWDNDWERLVFVPGIHIGDTLYLFRNGLDLDALRAISSPAIFRLDQDGIEYLHLASLRSYATSAGGTSYNTSTINNYVSNNWVDMIPLGNNYHKDVVFSMRFYERYDYEHFMLESETTSRAPSSGRMIAPMIGGWVKWQNHEMVISRGSYLDAIRDAEKWNTETTTDAPVANDPIVGSAVQVIAGEGSVAILNAAGKRVTISNVLGQTVAGAVLTSDNATIAAPKGILVVAVEGESAVKAVVK